MDEHVWDQTGGPRPTLHSHVGIVVAIAFVAFAVSIIVVGLWVSGGTPHRAAHPSTSAVASQSPAASPAGKPVAFWTYPTRRGVEIGTVDESGNIKRCRDFPGAEVRDWFGPDLYLQNDVGIFRVALSCSTSWVISYRAIPDHRLLPRPTDSSGRPPLDCVAISPHGMSLLISVSRSEGVTSWTGSVEGKDWHLVGTQPDYNDPCRWIDETHFLAGAETPYAVDTRSGRVAFVTDPALAADGNTSSTGNHVAIPRLVRNTTSFDVEERWELIDVDRGTSMPMAKSVQPAVANDHLQRSVWNPSGTMLLTLTQPTEPTDAPSGAGLKYEAAYADGTQVDLPISEAASSSVGWFDDHSIYVLGSSVDVIDVITGATRFSFSPSSTQTPELFVPGTRMGAPPTRIVSTAHGISRHVERSGLSFLLPPGLEVDPCVRCNMGPYPLTRFIPFPAHVATETCTNGLLTFGTTRDSPGTVRARMNSYVKLGKPGTTDPSDGDYVSLRTSSMTIGSIRFTVLDYSFYECFSEIAVGQVGGTTYIIDLTAARSDPVISFILRSIRFAT